MSKNHAVGKVPLKVEPQEDAPDSLFFHCNDVYEKMMTHSKEVETEDGMGTMIIYEGHLTHLFTREMHLSTPYYTKVTRALKRMGCIRQVRRGGGPQPSQWEMIRNPTRSSFEYDKPKPEKQGSTKIEMLEDQMMQHNKRLQALEDALMGIVQEEVSSAS